MLRSTVLGELPCSSWSFSLFDARHYVPPPRADLRRRRWWTLATAPLAMVAVSDDATPLALLAFSINSRTYTRRCTIARDQELLRGALSCIRTYAT